MTSDRLRRFLADTQTIGRYEIVQPLGEGGMAVVHEAWDPTLMRRVAIKVMKNPNPERVRREAAAAAGLRHPNIVAVHEACDDYIVMDLVEGPTLAQSMAELDLRQRLAILAVVAQAVAHAHAAGVIHRDLKPGNVILRNGHDPVLTDFGLAQATRDDPIVIRNDAGTAPYMAPEQMRGQAVSPATDVWALGVMIYEAVAGQRPFTGETLDALRAVIVNGEAPLIAHAIAPVVARALQKDPLRRYHDAGELADDIDRVLIGGEAAETPQPRYVRLKSWAYVAGALAVLAMVLTIVPRFRAQEHGPASSIQDRQQDFARQERELSRALQERPRDASLYLQRAQVRALRGDDARDHGGTPFADWAAAEDDLTRTLELRPESQDAQLARGTLFAQRCAYKRLYGIDPLADCEAAERDLDPLVDGLPRALAWRGNARFHRGVWLSLHGQDGKQWFQLAEADLSQTSDADTLARRGRVRAYLGRHQEAEADFVEALRQESGNVWFWMWRGIAQRHAGALEAARAHLTRAIKINPEQAEAWAERGQVHFALSRYREAVGDLETAIQHNPAWQPVLTDVLEQARGRAAQ